MLRIRGRTLRTEPLDRSNARDSERVVRLLREVDVSPVSPSSTTRYEKERSGLNHWTGVTQGTWNKSCGYYGKWTSFLLFRVRMLRIRGRTLRDESLETNTARDLKQVVRMFVEMDVGPVSPSSTSQDARHRAQKWNVGLERRKERETFCKILHSAKDLGVGIANCIGI